MPRRLPILLLAGVAMWHSNAAAADACVDSYDLAQRLRHGGRLVEARRQLLICAQQTCPVPIVKECTGWLREVGDSLPTIVFGAKDEHGADAFDVRVYEGQKLVAERLDGRALFVDPGAHEFRFAFPGGAEVKRRVLIRQAEKNREIDARLPPDPGPKSARHAAAADRGLPPPPTLSLVLGVVGVVGLASMTYFGLDALATKRDLEKSCSPACTDAELAPLRRKELATDISLGVGLAALAGGTWIWLSYDPHPRAGSALSAKVGGRF